MNTGAPAIDARDLTRVFGTLTAVDTLNINVGRGELFGLVGPDGAGKTTILRMLAGILPPTSGDAFIHGISVRSAPESVKHHIAYMSQRFGLYTDLTVEENIRFYADLYQVPAAAWSTRVERLYAFSNLGPFASRLAGHLSGGMKQKLSLCCALIHHPDVLLLDEPTFGVDPISRRDLWLIIHQMVAEGVTVFVSTAYLDEAERCDRIALLNTGRIVALDTPAAVQATLAGRVMSVRADNPRVARNALSGVAGVEHVSLFGDSLHVTLEDPNRDWPPLGRMLHEKGIAVHSAETIPPTLEDAFIHLVERAGDPVG